MSESPSENGNKISWFQQNFTSSSSRALWKWRSGANYGRYLGFINRRVEGGIIFWRIKKVIGGEEVKIEWEEKKMRRERGEGRLERRAKGTSHWGYFRR